MTKAIGVFVPVLACLLTIACPMSVPKFSLVGYAYHRADSGSRDVASGDTVNFDVVLEYEAEGII